MMAASSQNNGWIADLPSRWRMLRLKHIASCNDEVLHEDTLETQEIEYVDIGSVSSLGEIISTETMLFVDAPSRARRIGREGDVLVSTVRTYLKAIAPVRTSRENFVASTGFAVIRGGSDAVSGYLAYALRAEGFIGEVISRSVGISYPAINATDLVNISIPAPPRDEQTQIAKFLDYETAKIDGLIEKQQQLIALLKEKRQAVISHAVTKGLNPNAPMRHSGIEWLGEVPAHWEIWRSKRLFPESKLRTGIEDVQLTASQDWGVITQKEFVRRAGRRVVQINQHLDKRKRVERDDFVISMRSFQGGLERAWVSGGIRSSYIVLKPVNLVNIGYFERLFKSGQYIQALQSTANFIRDGQDLNYQNFCQVDLPLPPIEEQQDIAKFIDTTITGIDTLIEKAEDMTSVLQERRTALISAAVTGKIDVRGWQPPQSD